MTCAADDAGAVAMIYAAVFDLVVLEVAEGERRGRGRWYRRASSGASCGYTDDPDEIGVWRADEAPRGQPVFVTVRRADEVLAELAAPVERFAAHLASLRGAGS